MPKSHDPSRSKLVRPEMLSERLPGREDVERAIETILDRLLPKPRRSAKPRPDGSKPAARTMAHLTLVPDTGGDRG